MTSAPRTQTFDVVATARPHHIATTRPLLCFWNHQWLTRPLPQPARHRERHPRRPRLGCGGNVSLLKAVLLVCSRSRRCREGPPKTSVKSRRMYQVINPLVRSIAGASTVMNLGIWTAMCTYQSTYVSCRRPFSLPQQRQLTANCIHSQTRFHPVSTYTGRIWDCYSRSR
jgi:hypothetical protein